MPHRHPIYLPRVHHPSHATLLLALSLLYAIGSFLWFEPWRGNGYAPLFHGQLLASLTVDADLDLMPEYCLTLNPIETTQRAARHISPTGIVTERLPIGPALLSAPFWTAGHLLDLWVGSAAAGDRLHVFHRTALSLSALVHGFMGFLLLWRLLYRFTSRELAFFVAVSAFFGTLGMHACYRSVGHAAPYVFFSATAFWYAMVSYVYHPNWHRAVTLGLVAALLLITNWSALVFLPMLGVLLFSPGSFRPIKGSRKEKESRPDEQGDLADQTDVPSPAVHARVWRISLLWAPLVFIVMLLPQGVLWREQFDWWLPILRLPTGEIEGAVQTVGLARALAVGMWESLASLIRHFPLVLLALMGWGIFVWRRHAFGVVGLLTALLFLALSATPGPWRSAEEPGLVRHAALIPFFALGLVALAEEMRTHATRVILSAGMLVLAGWNVLVVLASLRMGEIADAWPHWARGAVWLDVFEHIARHPLAWAGDGIIMRYFSQGPPPLEQLFLLLLVIFWGLPACTWILLRYVLPAARKWKILRLVYLLYILLAIVFVVLIERAESPFMNRRANQALHRSMNAMLLSVKHRGTPYDPAWVYREVLRRFPLNLPARLLLAWHETQKGQYAKARVHYEDLRSRGFPVGNIGLALLAEDRKALLDAALPLRSFTHRDVGVSLFLIRALIAAGEKEEARNWLDRVFPPSYLYWELRARLEEYPARKKELLERALRFAPLNRMILWQRKRLPEKIRPAIPRASEDQKTSPTLIRNP